MGLKYQPKRRSMLFFPALNDRYCKHALVSGADSLVFDLEDSVSSVAKSDARRTLLKNFPKEKNGLKELLIRINNPKTRWYNDDLSILKELHPHAVVTAKTESPDEIRHLEKYLESYDHSMDRKTELVAVIESSEGYFRAKEILGSSQRITAVILGTEDLMGQLGIDRGRLEENPLLSHMLAEMAILCNHYNLQFIGPVTRGYKTKEHMIGLEQECKYLRSMNARGKVAIHPNQLEIINREFDITPEQIKQAKSTIGLFEEAQRANGAAVVSANDGMQDTPSLRKSKSLLAYAQKHGF